MEYRDRRDWAAVVNCTAAFLVGGGTGGKRKNGKSTKKDAWNKIYHTGGIYRGHYNMDKTNDRHIQHTPGQFSRYYRVGVLG